MGFGTGIGLAIASAAQRINGAADDYDELLTLIGEARFVLPGEATHGTDEFNAERARITQRLIAEQGFQALAVKADWPDAWRVNCDVRGDSGEDSGDSGEDSAGSDTTAQQTLGGFVRFPAWRWRNADAVQMVDWLYSHNAARPEAQRVGFYGLARAAPARATPFFYAQQNARLVMNAEAYYRTMFHGRVASWNLRDRHMADTLDALANHLAARTGTPVKIVVWAHNSHLGDARATKSQRLGKLYVGQLMRERHGSDARLIGFSTYDSWVTAASSWDSPAERKRVLPALPGSYEALLHEALPGNFLLPRTPSSTVAQVLEGHRLERAIGVLYLSASERRSHYFFASLAQQFDAVIHCDNHRSAGAARASRAPRRRRGPRNFPEGYLGTLRLSKLRRNRL